MPSIRTIIKDNEWNCAFTDDTKTTVMVACSIEELAHQLLASKWKKVREGEVKGGLHCSGYFMDFDSKKVKISLLSVASKRTSIWERKA